jgi:hypothetical protein
MTKLATLIAKMEGYGKPGAVPTTHNNPGDLRHSPHSAHPGDPNAIGQIDTPEHGWEDMDFEIQLILKQHPRLTLLDFVGGQRTSEGVVVPGGYPGWAPAQDNNQPLIYAQYLATGLGLVINSPLALAASIPAPSTPSLPSPTA